MCLSAVCSKPNNSAIGPHLGLIPKRKSTEVVLKELQEMIGHGHNEPVRRLARWSGKYDLFARLNRLRHFQPLNIPPKAVRGQLAELRRGKDTRKPPGTVVVTCDCLQELEVSSGRLSSTMHCAPSPHRTPNTTKDIKNVDETFMSETTYNQVETPSGSARARRRTHRYLRGP